jgi:hypothetical protein
MPCILSATQRHRIPFPDYLMWIKAGVVLVVFILKTKLATDPTFGERASNAMKTSQLTQREVECDAWG